VGAEEEDALVIHFKASIEWSVVCTRCGAGEILNRFTVHAGETLPLPTFPENWYLFDGLPLCPRHGVRIVDKEEEACDAE